MTYPRKSLISLADTPYYHVINRCVRRAFLCGVDKYTGIDYSHRRQWMVDRIGIIEKAFCINVCAYSVMSNHYHLVLFIDAESKLSPKEVARRWGQLYKLSDAVQAWIDDKPTTKTQRVIINQQIKRWRKRLYSISWFMRALNEHIAIKANKEDDVTGRFWQGRFYSQALLDEKALLQCMMYVDLNPIRAAIAKDCASSEYTSIQQRIHSLSKKIKSKASVNLMHFYSSNPIPNPSLHINQTPIKHTPYIPYKLSDYIELIDWTSRVVLNHKRGYVPENTPALLLLLGFNERQWINSCANKSKFYRVLGKLENIKALIDEIDQRTLYGQRQNKELFG